MKTFFIELFEYNLNSNKKFITLLQENEKLLSEKCIQLINHILNAHHVWNNRINPKGVPFKVWEIHPFRDLGTINGSNHERTGEILKGLELEKRVTYKNTKGDEYTNSIRDILFHVINHSNYHRAQIASELRRLEIQPPVSDYIFYKWSSI